MAEYESPDPAVGEMVSRLNAESERQHMRLRDEPSGALKAVLRDTGEPHTSRANALLFLMMRRDAELPDIVLELFSDPDQELWRSTIRSYCPDDARIKARLHELLDDDDDRNWSEAAVALARSGDTTLLPSFAAWLDTGNRPRRNVAIECLKALDVPEAHQVLHEFWDRGQGDKEDRLVVAAALLSVGDNRGASVLSQAARAGQGIWAVFAATSIYVCQPRDGLALIRQILDEGDLEAKQGMVNQIWNFAQLPRAFTPEGIHEARAWVQSEMEKQVT